MTASPHFEDRFQAPLFWVPSSFVGVACDFS